MPLWGLLCLTASSAHVSGGCAFIGDARSDPLRYYVVLKPTSRRLLGNSK